MDIDATSCEGSNDFVQADIRDMPFEDGHFGSVFCSHVLEHMPSIPDFVQALGELWRVADTVFTCTPVKFSLYAHTVDGHYLWVTPNRTGYLVEDRKTGEKVEVTL